MSSGGIFGREAEEADWWTVWRDLSRELLLRFVSWMKWGKGGRGRGGTLSLIRRLGWVFLRRRRCLLGSLIGRGLGLCFLCSLEGMISFIQMVDRK